MNNIFVQYGDKAKRLYNKYRFFNAKYNYDNHKVIFKFRLVYET